MCWWISRADSGHPFVPGGRGRLRRGRARDRCSFILALLVLTVLLPAPVLYAAEKIHPHLKALTAAALPGQKLPVIIKLSGKADLGRAVRGPRGRRSAVRAKPVVRALKQRSRAVRDRVLGRLAGAGSRRAPERARWLWIVNSLAVELTPGEIATLSRLPEVEIILADQVFRLAAPLPAGAATPEWNLAQIGVPLAWGSGYRGQGVVVAILDSGADVGHPDLSGAWRGNDVGGTFPPQSHWFDPYGEHPLTPHDAHPEGHGTGVTGLVVGGDASGTAIGVAPDAQWIAAKVFNDAGDGLLSATFACLQWALDPDDDPLTDDEPQVVNGSWSFDNPGEFAGSPGGFLFREALQALRAAGILPVFAAGNSGNVLPDSSESPANYPEAVAVGMTDQADQVHSLSGRGPSAFDGVTIYPGLVAPGVSVRTADRTFGFWDPVASYRSSTGTSFSAPHVTGSAALLWSADPTLSPDLLELELLSAAVDLPAGAPDGPDHVAGHGRLDLARSRVLVGAAAGGVDSVVLDADWPSPQGSGRSIRFSATASGGTGAVEYRFWANGPGTGETWVLVQDYSPAAGWWWDTTDADAGVTRVVVHARRVGASVNYEAAGQQQFEIEAVPATFGYGCPNDQDLWPFQWTGTAPNGDDYRDCASAPALNYGSAACVNFTGVAGPEDIDQNGDGVFDAFASVACMHLGAGDGFAEPADAPANYDQGSLYLFGFSDLTGVARDEAFQWGRLANQSPAPTIQVREGQEFYLSLSNLSLVMRPDRFDPHAFHWHGLPNVAALFGGVADNSAAVNPGSTWTYYFKVPGPGTYLYAGRAATAEPRQMGMTGSLYVTPRQDGLSLNGYTRFAYNDGDGSTGYDVDFPLQLMAFDPAFHEANLLGQPLPFAALNDTLYVINGRGYPDTVVDGPLGPLAPNGETRGSPTGAKITATAGETILLRLSAAMVQGSQTVTVLGIPMKVVGKDAKLLRGPDPDGAGPLVGKDLSYTTHSVTLAGGETYDILLHTANVAPGTYYLYSRNLYQLNNNREERGGTMTEIVIW